MIFVNITLMRYHQYVSNSLGQQKIGIFWDIPPVNRFIGNIWVLKQHEVKKRWRYLMSREVLLQFLSERGEMFLRKVFVWRGCERSSRLNSAGESLVDLRFGSSARAQIHRWELRPAGGRKGHSCDCTSISTLINRVLVRFFVMKNTVQNIFNKQVIADVSSFRKQVSTSDFKSWGDLFTLFDMFYSICKNYCILDLDLTSTVCLI